MRIYDPQCVYATLGPHITQLVYQAVIFPNEHSIPIQNLGRVFFSFTSRDMIVFATRLPLMTS